MEKLIMNRLIIIGNGFDLAHGIKTSYNDFILWYLKKSFDEALEYGSNIDKEIIEIVNISKSVYPFKTIEDFIKYFYDLSFKDFDRPNLWMPGNSTTNQNPFTITLKSRLLRELLAKCSGSNWVDIENEFYSILKLLLPSVNDHGNYKTKQLESLNKSLKFIIEQLEEYLQSLDTSQSIYEYETIFSSPIYEREICTKKVEADEKAETTTILNFNYTETPKKYLTNDLSNIKINYIHGRVSDSSNPLIFGFGDELDSNYHTMELQKSNLFFEYIKSFWYFKTSNYHNLVRFVESNEFQVYILGHSCGLSDRTMLNMIFEHENCKSIKIFYHGNKKKNNFTNLTQEISRHFKDKGMMRKKIVPFDKSEPMPQVE